MHCEPFTPSYPACTHLSTDVLLRSSDVVSWRRANVSLHPLLASVYQQRIMPTSRRLASAFYGQRTKVSFFLLPGVKNLFPIYLFHLFSWCWAFLSYCICTSTIFFVKGWSVLYILEIEESIYRDVIGSFKWKRRNFEFEFFLCLDKIFLIKIRSKLTIFRVKFLS